MAANGGVGGHLWHAGGAASGPWVPARRNGRRTRCVTSLRVSSRDAPGPILGASGCAMG